MAEMIAVQMPMFEALKRALRTGNVLVDRAADGAMVNARAQFNRQAGDESYTDVPLALLLGVLLEEQTSGQQLDSPWEGRWYRIYHREED